MGVGSTISAPRRIRKLAAFPSALMPQHQNGPRSSSQKRNVRENDENTYQNTLNSMLPYCVRLCCRCEDSPNLSVKQGNAATHTARKPCRHCDLGNRRHRPPRSESTGSNTRVSPETGFCANETPGSSGPPDTPDFVSQSA